MSWVKHIITIIGDGEEIETKEYSFDGYLPGVAALYAAIYARDRLHLDPLGLRFSVSLCGTKAHAYRCVENVGRAGFHMEDLP